MTTRRQALVVLGASALASLAAVAKAQSTKVFRIGYVGASFSAGDTRPQALQAANRAGPAAYTLFRLNNFAKFFW